MNQSCNSEYGSGNAICIYGASSENISESYKLAAFKCGSMIARSRHPLVCGGGRAGLMRCAIDGALSEKGCAIGVLPHFMTVRNWAHPGLTEVIDTLDMHQRKQTMARMSIGAIALPGGCGTLEELLEIITWRKLNLYKGNVVILNIDGYYDPLIEMLDRTIVQGFMDKNTKPAWFVASSPEEAVTLVLNSEA